MNPRPDLVLFDAVGTLIEPVPSAGDVYRQFGRQFGCENVDYDYQLALISAMREVEVENRHRSGRMDEAFEYECWRQVVRQVFNTSVDADKLFVALWQYFAEPKHWKLFPDVVPTINELMRRGYRLGIASNFDARLLRICRELPPLDVLDPIFVSSQVGWAKPARSFYTEIERVMQLSSERILIVGDNLIHDYHVPKYCGWQAQWLKRNGEAAKSGEWIPSLAELLDLLPECEC